MRERLNEITETENVSITQGLKMSNPYQQFSQCGTKTKAASYKPRIRLEDIVAALPKTEGLTTDQFRRRLGVSVHTLRNYRRKIKGFDEAIEVYKCLGHDDWYRRRRVEKTDEAS